MSYRNTAAVLSACLGLSLGSAAFGATITEDFESGAGDWATYNSGNGTYNISAVGNPGNAGVLDNTGANTVSPEIYIANTALGFDATQPISGTFDFYLVEDGNYSYGNFILGAIDDGLSNQYGEFLNVELRERTFGNRARLRTGDGAIAFNGDGNNQYRIETDEWESASFTWTPTSGATGDFSFTWTGSQSPQNRGPMTITGYTFDSPAIYIGFGSGDSPIRFDNVNITGTDVIPEPSSLALLGLGGLLIARRRR